MLLLTTNNQINFTFNAMGNMKLNKKIILVIIIFVFVFSLALAVPNGAHAAFGLDTSFKQVKTADSPAVYYLDHARGFKKAYVNAKAFLAYGNKWADIKIVSQADLDKWPEMQLAKEKDNPAVYYLKNGKKVLIENTTTASRFSNSKLLFGSSFKALSRLKEIIFCFSFGRILVKIALGKNTSE